MSSWQLIVSDKELIARLSEETGLSNIICTVLVNRGVTTSLDMCNYINTKIENLTNPFLLSGMVKAAERIRKAVYDNEKILIYGDKDVDGLTAVCVMHNTLKALGSEPLWYIPSDEGYGLHEPVIKEFADKGVSLIITVDCGITALNQIDYANSLGIDVVVTDHHAPVDPLPSAYAIINPKVAPDYTFKDLAGCSVAFKLSEALMLSFGKSFNIEFAAIDIETTGLNPAQDQICELSAVLFKNGVIQGTFSTLVKISKPIHPVASAVNGITDDMLENAPEPEIALKKFFDFIGLRTLVAHNSDFDLSFLKLAAKKYFRREISNPVVDTLLLARKLLACESYKLASVAKKLEVLCDESSLHRALADAMLAYKVYLALERLSDCRMDYFRRSAMDLLALGTIADIMPLIAENRIIVKEGLKSISNTQRVGLKKLVERCHNPIKNGPGFTAKTIAWQVSPVLNAAGRMGKASVALKLLLSCEEREAHDLINELLDLNDDRKNLQSLNLEKFEPLLKLQCDVEKDKILIVCASDLAHGVTGIIASRISKKYNKPTVLLINQGDEAVGSARSAGGFDITAAFSKVSHLLVKFGGHAQAAGLTIKTENIPLFTQELKKVAGELLSELSQEQKTLVDLELSLSEISPDLLMELAKLEPFGAANPEPIFIVRDVKLHEIAKIGDHLKLKVSKNSAHRINAFGRDMGSLKNDFCENQHADLLLKVESNFWQDTFSVQLNLLDIIPV
ncbi:MAG: exonuclease domain-containing protein [Endomicrobiales bacterium]|nr:exonuclease domain-containing protein [Endomicrobiales bacterium]